MILRRTPLIQYLEEIEAQHRDQLRLERSVVQALETATAGDAGPEGEGAQESALPGGARVLDWQEQPPGAEDSAGPPLISDTLYSGLRLVSRGGRSVPLSAYGPSEVGRAAPSPFPSCPGADGCGLCRIWATSRPLRGTSCL